MNQKLLNKKVLITAGPTREAIDPVRYISNHSSGKMGYAIAESFLAEGAFVYLVSGPVSISLQDHPRLKIIPVNAALEMYLACCRLFEQVDIAVFAAAVADYRPEKTATQKIKKDEDSFIIKMVKNIDIACEFGKVKSTAQFSIGFALETNDEKVNATMKLKKKNFDMIVLNSLNDSNMVFGADVNKISIIKSDFTQLDFPVNTKRKVADDIVGAVSCLLKERMMVQFEETI